MRIFLQFYIIIPNPPFVKYAPLFDEKNTPNSAEAISSRTNQRKIQKIGKDGLLGNFINIRGQNGLKSLIIAIILRKYSLKPLTITLYCGII